jgi:allophanate hydrolase subunit 1
VSVRYLSCGDTAFTVEFGNEISPEINGRVMALHAAIGRARDDGKLGGVVETVPTMRSLMVTYDPLATSRAERRRVGGAGPGGQPEEPQADRPLLL